MAKNSYNEECAEKVIQYPVLECTRKMKDAIANDSI